MKTKIFLVVAALMAVSVFAGSQPMGSDSYLRVVHGNSEAPAVTVWADGFEVFEDLESAEASVYARIPMGMHTLQVTPYGDTEPVVKDQAVELMPRTDYTVVAYGDMESIGAFVVQDEVQDVPERSAAVRFVHAVHDAPAVDIAVKDGPVIFPNVEFQDVAEYIWVPRGEYHLVVRVAGTDRVMMPLDARISQSSTYTVYATGSLHDIEVLVVEDNHLLTEKYIRTVLH